MSRTPILSANWKMHRIPDGALTEHSPYRSSNKCDVWVFPCALDIAACVSAGLQVGIQAGRAEETGAFTGDLSLQMARDSGCTLALCGHSERRTYHGETDADIAAQLHAAQAVSLQTVLCIGETASQHADHATESVLASQLANLPLTEQSVIAYEPVWAIGTGIPADPEHVQHIHASIRSMIPEKLRDSLRILYGGSVGPDSLAGLMAQPDVDGVLVGSASLHTETFAQMHAMMSAF